MYVKTEAIWQKNSGVKGLKVYYYALCFPLQPKSTSTALIGKTASSAEEQESLSNTATKDEDTEGEWMEQKIDFRKLPRQYMQLSKIRLTGNVIFPKLHHQRNLWKPVLHELAKKVVPNSPGLAGFVIRLLDFVIDRPVSE